MLNINAQTNNKKLLKISKNALISNIKLINNTEFPMVEFTLSAIFDGYELEAVSHSSKLTPKQTSIIKSTKIGNKVYFTDILVKGNDGSVRKLNDKVMIIK